MSGRARRRSQRRKRHQRQLNSLINFIADTPEFKQNVIDLMLHGSTNAAELFKHYYADVPRWGSDGSGSTLITDRINGK